MEDVTKIVFIKLKFRNFFKFYYKMLIKHNIYFLFTQTNVWFV